MVSKGQLKETKLLGASRAVWTVRDPPGLWNLPSGGFSGGQEVEDLESVFLIFVPLPLWCLHISSFQITPTKRRQKLVQSIFRNLQFYIQFKQCSLSGEFIQNVKLSFTIKVRWKLPDQLMWMVCLWTVRAQVVFRANSTLHSFEWSTPPAMIAVQTYNKDISILAISPWTPGPGTHSRRPDHGSRYVPLRSSFKTLINLITSSRNIGIDLISSSGNIPINLVSNRI